MRPQDVLITNKTRPVVVLFNLFHVPIGEIGADAFVAEDKRAR